MTPIALQLSMAAFGQGNEFRRPECLRPKFAFRVLNAYAQLLAEGYLESRVGAGTVIAGSLPDQLTSSGPAGSAHAPTPSGPRPVARRCSILPRVACFPWLQSWGAFRVGQVAFDQFPLHVWSNLVARHCRSMEAHAFHYGDQSGS